MLILSRSSAKKHTHTQTQSNKPRYPLGRAEFTSWLSSRECCCNPLLCRNHKWFIPLVMLNWHKYSLANGNTTKATEYAPICSGEMRGRKIKRYMACWKMASHLTQVCALETRGGLSPWRRASVFHCEGEVRVYNLCLDNTESESLRFSFNRGGKCNTWPKVSGHPNITPISSY